MKHMKKLLALLLCLAMALSILPMSVLAAESADPVGATIGRPPEAEAPEVVPQPAAAPVAPPIPQPAPAAQPAPQVPRTIFCMNCGAQLPGHAKFCSKCGAKVVIYNR